MFRATKIYIGLSVIVDVPDSDAASVVEIDIVKDIQRLPVEQRVLKIDTRLVLIQLREQRIMLFVVAAACAE